MTETAVGTRADRDIKPGDGILIYSGIGDTYHRAVVIEAFPDGRFSVDCRTRNYSGPGKPGHFILDPDRDFFPDPQGPFAIPVKFICDNRHCCHSHRAGRKTVLTVCPNCGQSITRLFMEVGR